jgi:hypothetical protein
MSQKNIPYVKHLDENGLISNPIVGNLITKFANRKNRRQIKQKSRFHGESKNTHLSVNKYSKYLRVKQLEKDKHGNKKFIEHYILVK